MQRSLHRKFISYYKEIPLCSWLGVDLFIAVLFISLLRKELKKMSSSKCGCLQDHRLDTCLILESTWIVAPPHWSKSLPAMSAQREHFECCSIPHAREQIAFQCVGTFWFCSNFRNSHLPVKLSCKLDVLS